MDVSSGRRPVFDAIRQIIIEQTKATEDKITLNTRFSEDLDADSLDLFQIINDIEDTYSISIDETHKIVTVGDAVNAVERLIEK